MFLRKLETKYRKGVNELIVYRVGLDEQEARLQSAEDDLSGLEREQRQLFEQLKNAAAELSKHRAKAAKRLASETQKQFAELGMADARLGAELTQVVLGDDPSRRRSRRRGWISWS